MRNPDEPDPSAHWDLRMPFVVCASKGGPYDDQSFVAGYQAGMIDAQLQVARGVGARTVHFPIVHTELVPQLVLIGMGHGYPAMDVDSSQQWPQWCAVTFKLPDTTSMLALEGET